MNRILIPPVTLMMIFNLGPDELPNLGFNLSLYKVGIIECIYSYLIGTLNTSGKYKCKNQLHSEANLFLRNSLFLVSVMSPFHRNRIDTTNTLFPLHFIPAVFFWLVRLARLP